MREARRCARWAGSSRGRRRPGTCGTPGGSPTSWTTSATRPAASGGLGPNRPLFVGGTGIYLKSFSFEGAPVAVLMVNKDPGALWALAGSILFAMGSVTVLLLKWKKA